MGIKDAIRHFEEEAEKIAQKIAALNARDEVVQLMLKELRGAAGVKKSAGRKPAKKATRKGPGRRAKGSLTVRDAILKVVAGAEAALPAKEIISGAVKLSGGAVASIRTQINALAKAGLMKQVPYEGRGFRYTTGSGKPAAPAKKAPAKKKVTKKKATKKKATKKK
ncbi:MAG: hypothetical protein ACYTDX_09730 [Planctomycetota bacterium]|jgi:hypothetical protein